MQLSAPYTPIEFYDASFYDGSSHALWCVRVTGSTQYTQLTTPKGYVVPPPNDFVDSI